MPDSNDPYREADELASRVRAEGEETAFEKLEQALAHFRDSGHSVDALLPTDLPDALGFSLGRARTGKSFWKIYAEILRDKLCQKNQEFARLATAGLSGSACAIASAIMTAFALPAAAVSIVIPMSAIIAVTGIDAFCRYTAPDPRSSGRDAAIKRGRADSTPNTQQESKPRKGTSSEDNAMPKKPGRKKG